MITIKKMIEELEKIDDKEMEVAVRVDTRVMSLEDVVYECEADGTPFMCIDAEDFN